VGGGGGGEGGGAGGGSGGYRLYVKSFSAICHMRLIFLIIEEPMIEIKKILKQYGFSINYRKEPLFSECYKCAIVGMDLFLTPQYNKLICTIMYGHCWNITFAITDDFEKDLRESLQKLQSCLTNDIEEITVLVTQGTNNV
jgi:hypothetical protein